MKIIGGRWRGRILKSPKGKVRPTSGQVREALFNILDVEGAAVLDLFAGSGAVGLEALSRGAERVTFVEEERRALACIKENIALVGAEDCTLVVARDVVKFLEKAGGSYDFIFADPPYERGIGNRVLEDVANSSLLKEGGVLVIEESERAEPLEGCSPLALAKRREYGGSVLWEFVHE